jgi:hypothetical protein
MTEESTRLPLNSSVIGARGGLYVFPSEPFRPGIARLVVSGVTAFSTFFAAFSLVPRRRFLCGVPVTWPVFFATFLVCLRRPCRRRLRVADVFSASLLRLLARLLRVFSLAVSPGRTSPSAAETESAHATACHQQISEHFLPPAFFNVQDSFRSERTAEVGRLAEWRRIAG